MRTFDVGEMLRLIGDSKVGVTHICGVATHYQFMEQHPAFHATDLTRLVCAGVGGSPTPTALLASWAERGVVLRQIYGLSEAGPTVTVLDKVDALRKLGSAGRPVLHTEVRLVDADGEDVPPGTTGELWIRGPNVTPGYWNRPEEAQAVLRDGWLRSGDAAVVDPEGFFTIVDRWKDMYISGGENVYPAEVENVLYERPEVAEAAVIAVPDRRWGEVGRAVVVLKKDASLSEDSLIAHCAAKLARYKLPRSVVFAQALPRNATGKVHKPTLRQQFGA
jgi:fatty-acyl-CoA synthase